MAVAWKEQTVELGDVKLRVMRGGPTDRGGRKRERKIEAPDTFHPIVVLRDRQLLDGDWDAKPPGDLFRREWFEIVDEAPEPAVEADSFLPQGHRWAGHWAVFPVPFPSPESALETRELRAVLGSWWLRKT